MSFAIQKFTSGQLNPKKVWHHPQTIPFAIFYSQVDDDRFKNRSNELLMWFFITARLYIAEELELEADLRLTTGDGEGILTHYPLFANQNKTQ